MDKSLNPKISVVIPVYNVEKYLVECLESVSSQTLTDIEIICVDDGSTDRSLEILREYAKKEPRIQIFTQVNSSQATARNAGAGKARGEYVYFLDSDDIIIPEALRLLYDKASKDNLDLVYFDADGFCNEEGCDKSFVDWSMAFYHRKNDYPEVYTGYELMHKMFEKGEYRNSPCLQMIKREYFLAGNQFKSGLLHEDNLYTFKTCINATRAGYIHKSLYKRRIRPNSVMTGRVTSKLVTDYFRNYLLMSELLKAGEHSDDEYLWNLVYAVLACTRRDYLKMSLEERNKPAGFTTEQQQLYKALVLDWAQALNNTKIKKLKAYYQEAGAVKTLGHVIKLVLKKLHLCK